MHRLRNTWKGTLTLWSSLVQRDMMPLRTHGSSDAKRVDDTAEGALKPLAPEAIQEDP